MKLVIDLAYWWERAFVAEDALMRCPGDRLATKEMRMLIDLKDRLVASLRDQGDAHAHRPEGPAGGKPGRG